MEGMKPTDKPKMKTTTQTTSAVNVVTIAGGRSYFNKAMPARIVHGEEITVFLGPDKFMEETRIPSFTLEYDGRKGKPATVPNCQYGRDFIFVQAGAQS